MNGIWSLHRRNDLRCDGVGMVAVAGIKLRSEGFMVDDLPKTDKDLYRPEILRGIISKV